MLSTNAPNASRSISSRSRRTSWNMPSVSAVSAGSAGGAAPRRERAGQLGAPPTRAMPPSPARAARPSPPPVRQRSPSAAFSLVVFSRTSRRTVLNRNDSTSRRTGRTSAAAISGRPACDQLVLDQLEIGQQRVGRGVAGGIGPGVAALGVLDHHLIRRSMQREILAEHLARVAAGDLLGLPGGGQLAVERRAEPVGDRHGLLGDAERPHQLVDPAAVAAQAGQPVLEQRAVGDVVGDERIAVAVAADPGAELEERRHDPLLARIVLRQHPLDLVQQVGHRLEQGLVEEVQSPEHLLGHGRLLQAELAGEPEQLDLVPEPVDQRLALARRPAGRLEVHQPAVDARGASPAR